MALDSVDELVDSLRRLRLLEAEQEIVLVSDLLPNFAEPKALAGELIRRGWLTPYQANFLLQGRGRELTLGSYVLLEQIGEGGMGQVFKAKNWKLGRIVALKLIRKERLASEEAVRRFHREIRAVAQLSHPNIVLAYDADEVNGVHFFAMEYVEGSDLAKLVKQHGPQPVAQACDWIRQAALGLQHAHERGLVHRDVKPHNLLLTKQGVVKILDMGLARLSVGDEDGEVSTTMTQEGAVMGTPDYMAPEQAEESHTVDVRADLYSLGCTLYQLLAGKVPFPGGTLIQKLKKHQSEQPVPIEMLRPDVPAAVAAVVRKLMAKRPQERYQTPAALVRALETLPDEGSRTLPGGTPSGANIALMEPTVDVALDFRPSDQTVQAMRGEQRSRRHTENRNLLIATVGGGFLLIGLATALWLFLWPSRPPLPEKQPVAVDQPEARKEGNRSFEQWLREVADLPAEEKVQAVAAELKKRNPGFDGKLTHKIEGGLVTMLQFASDEVTDLQPIRALRQLTYLDCRGSRATGGNGVGKLTDLSPLKGLPLRSLYCGLTLVPDLTPLRGMPLETLFCHDCPIRDLSALAGFRLKELHFSSTAIADLSPLKGMPLNRLECAWTKVADLSPLKGMPLTTLICSGTQVTDLTPLKGLPLTLLNCHSTKVADLSPLRGMPLNGLYIHRTQVVDLSPLKGLPLARLRCDFQPDRDAAILRSIETLKTINGKPAAEFWKDVDARQAAFEAWCKQVAAMPAKKQVEAVALELKKRNPGFDGQVNHNIANDVVTGVGFASDEVMDISPVRALKRLTNLDCGGSKASLGIINGKLEDLSPLKGLPLRRLNFFGTRVSDLRPLRGMPLEYLGCGIGLVHDLSPLQDAPLKWLYCARTRVSDLTPLKGKKDLLYLYCNHTDIHDLSPLAGLRLRKLYCRATAISDLSPLKGMPLEIFFCQETRVTDLSLLETMPLKRLECDFKPKRDAAILRSIKTLESINGKPAAEFWKEVGDPPKP